MKQGLHVLLDMRVSKASGGVLQAATGLASGLSSLAGDEHYDFLAYRRESAWLKPFLAGNSRLLEVERPRPLERRLGRSLRLLGLPRPAGRIENRQTERAAAQSQSDVVHFTHQFPFRTKARTIYQPHDLQHRHFAQFFSRAEARRRDAGYVDSCRRSDMVVVMSKWGRSDIVREYEIEEGKVFVIPWGAPVGLYRYPDEEDLRRIAAEHHLTRSFLIYPAQTWPHKNHFRLLQALQVLQSRGATDLELICTGYTGATTAAVLAEARRLGVQDRIRFLGWIPPEDMAALYRLSRGLIYPSLFEGWGMPVMESFSLGVPVACSRIPVLQEQAADAAVYFDPYDVSDIADAMAALWSDEDLRERLIDGGRRRAQALDWSTIAEAFRAHYRRLAEEPITDRDEHLLSLSVSGEWLG